MPFENVLSWVGCFVGAKTRTEKAQPTTTLGGGGKQGSERKKTRGAKRKGESPQKGGKHIRGIHPGVEAGKEKKNKAQGYCEIQKEFFFPDPGLANKGELRRNPMGNPRGAGVKKKKGAGFHLGGHPNTYRDIGAWSEVEKERKNDEKEGGGLQEQEGSPRSGRWSRTPAAELWGGKKKEDPEKKVGGKRGDPPPRASSNQKYLGGGHGNATGRPWGPKSFCKEPKRRRGREWKGTRITGGRYAPNIGRAKRANKKKKGRWRVEMGGGPGPARGGQKKKGPRGMTIVGGRLKEKAELETSEKERSAKKRKEKGGENQKCASNGTKNFWEKGRFVAGFSWGKTRPGKEGG